jgi:hypothetical protein
MKLNFTSHRLTGTTAILLAILLISSCSDHGDIKTHELDGEYLFGKVKSVKEFSYEASERFGKIEKGDRGRKSDFWEHDKFQVFNPQGNTIEITTYESNGNLLAKYSYKYQYDNKENVTERSGYKSDATLTDKIVYKYDDKDNLVEVETYNSDGTLDDKKTYQYDVNGNNIEENVYSSNGNLSYKFVTKYDDNGNNVERIQYDSDGTISDKLTIEYDGNDNATELKWYNKDGSLSSIFTWSHDEQGNQTERRKYEPDGSLTAKTTYEYDDRNNSVMSVDFENEAPTFMLVREIEYFD